MESISTIISFFQEGGLFMYPIVLVLAVGIAIAIERYIYLTAMRSANQRQWKELMDVLSRHDFQRALGISQKSKAAIGKILLYGLERTKSARRRDDIETAMEEGVMEVMILVWRSGPTYLAYPGQHRHPARSARHHHRPDCQAFTAVGANANPAEKADTALGQSISVSR
jgi:biopolymer transport protein ExbB